MYNIRIIKPLYSRRCPSRQLKVVNSVSQFVLCSAAHAAEVGDCEVSAVYF